MLYQLTYISPKSYQLPMAVNILREMVWENHKLAYPIQHLTSAYYRTVLFEASPQEIKKLAKVIKLDQNIIRHLIIKDAPLEVKKITLLKKREEKTRETKKVDEKKLEEKLEAILGE